ncbi:MAG: bifunctional 4-hydroxy-2-oxoglutarate aldolase/2-dehydro-3-deoxy-phosphogluconate aldolase [Clostridia bacterium]|nr:bifunctional 4-hydroxy-2-oxoglutarate aldolase/2-dehydro-3-deoxy-phosphogluconate aldolase [Clostridia bacterium]
MKQPLEILRETGIVPVIRIESASDGASLAKALADGGLCAAEITFRTSAAADAIRAMRRAVPEMLVGAGTVLTPEALGEAIDAGARFGVSPGFRPAVASESVRRGLPFVPGVMTPTEIEKAMAEGFTTLKFFPAEAAGGVRMLKALTAPYGGISFMPTGGITLQNAADYLSLSCVLCCGGSFIAPTELIARGDFASIRARAREVADFIEGFRADVQYKG